MFCFRTPMLGQLKQRCRSWWQVFRHPSPPQVSVASPAVPAPVLTVNLSIVTQFYPPDFAATGQFVDELAQQLSQSGMQVQVFTGQPGYAFTVEQAPTLEMMGQVQVQRARPFPLRSRQFAGRTITSLFFCWQALLHLLNRAHRGDLLLLTSEPPFLPVLGYLLHRLFRTPYACLIYDLYPEVAVELKVLSQTHWLVQCWHAVNRQIWRSADTLIVPCQTMKDRIVARVPEVADKVTVVHNWADPTWLKPLPKASNPFAQTHNLVEPFTVLYSGNMGRCHDMTTVLEAARSLQDDPVQFVFIGGGPKLVASRQQVEDWGLTNCQFLPYQDKTLLPQSLTACDLSLVSIDVGMEGLVAPSKFYGSLAVGRPVAVICEPHSYLRELVAEARCGAAFNNGDSQGLAGFIRYLLKDPDMAGRMGRAGRRYLKAQFTPQAIGQQYRNLLNQAVLRYADLYAAIANQEFQVYYQPIVALGTQQITGFEALLRWAHPQRGLLSPAEFMDALEDSNLIIPVGWWLLQQACQQLQQWRNQLGQPDLRIQINFSYKQFFQTNLVAQIDQVLQHHGLTGSALVVEIKDAIVMQDAAATTALLLQFQSRQIQVCIDDFGTNHTSLEYLHRFPVNALKIDRSIVAQLLREPDAVKLLETILVVTNDLNMEAIALGIESQEQIRRLRELGVSHGQGYGLAAPHPDQPGWTVPLLLMSEDDQLEPPTSLTAVSLPPLVLIVDDDRSMRTLLRKAVEREGYRVAESTSGEDCLQACQQLRPDLVLLDAMMPTMDGFTCCLQLMASAPASGAESDHCQLALPQVVMVTALDDAESVERAFEVGATDYLTKPIHWPLLRQRLKRLLQR